MNADQRKAARDLFNEGEPGFGIKRLRVHGLARHRAAMCDTSACDAQPSGEQGPDFAVPCHTEMQTRRGIWNLETSTEVPCRQESLEGAFNLGAAPDDRRTGSPANPVVIY